MGVFGSGGCTVGGLLLLSALLGCGRIHYDRAGNANVDATAPDVGPPDAAQPRGGVDAFVQECERDEQCDDAFACSGIERCVEGRCVAGAPVDCDDSLMCTRDVCDEPSGVCLAQRDDSLCPPGNSCEPAVGCRDGCFYDPCWPVPPACGCAEGEFCRARQSGVARCDGTFNAIDDFETCGSLTDCNPESICVSYAGSPRLTHCVPLCLTDLDCPLPGSRCGSFTDTDVWGGCSRPCDPVRQTGCADGTFCQLVLNDLSRPLTQCTNPIGTLEEGASCDGSERCVPGTECVSVAGARVCTRHCVSDDDCDGRCDLRFAGAHIVLGETDYGFCVDS